jgi:hypothetical protein
MAAAPKKRPQLSERKREKKHSLDLSESKREKKALVWSERFFFLIGSRSALSMLKFLFPFQSCKFSIMIQR